MVHRNTVCADGGCAVAVATLVAETDDVDPLELFPIHEIVDTAALDRLITTADDSVTVEFEYAGREIALSGDGVVRMSDEKTK